MKKVIALLVAFILIMGTLPVMAKIQREVWEPSPGVTSGVTSSEIMFNKAIHMGDVRMYQLSSIGSRYYLGVVEEQRDDGGSNGKKKTSFLTYYSILETDDGFIILGSCGVSNEYYWDGLEGVLDISSSINKSYYTNQGYEAPYYIINPHDKYTYSDWNEYDEFIFIGSNGGIAIISDWTDYGQARFPMIFESKLYTGQNKYYSSSRSYFYYLSDGSTKATKRRIIGIKNNAIVEVAAPASVAVTDITTANGYTVFNDGMSGNMTARTGVKDWWHHYLDNKFSDGRYVVGRWVGMGNSMYEIWYDIYDKDGQLISTGASDFSTVASSSLRTTPLQGFVINDTKIILCLSSLDNDWFNEYFRAAVVTENEDGILEVPLPIGKKNIVAPGSSETIPVSSTVDFALDDLSLGFNIKENIIGANKLTSGLREQVNSIRLDPITIVIKEGSVRGKWNTGISLPSYNNHDYSYSSGDTSVYFHSNGSTFNWSCSNPEKLIPGTYHKMYYVDGKSFYVKVNIIAPPSNDSATTVVF